MGLLEKPPFRFYDESLPFMKEGREEVMQNIKETKLFLKTELVGKEKMHAGPPC
jgi:hypothetical protein